MSANTTIEWCDRSWNPVRGCSIVSPGCTNCYAMRQAHRFSGPGQPYEGLTRLAERGPIWTGKIRLVPEALEEPLHWKKPSRIFVNSMSDLFHEDVPENFVVNVWDVMRRAERHTFQILTKRPARMRDFCSRLYSFKSGHPYLSGFHGPTPIPPATHMVLPNVWLGVSAENREQLNRIAILQEIRAVIRFVSIEPLLEDLGTIRARLCGRDDALQKIDWVIVGGESGPNARPCNIDWIRAIVDQCKAAGTRLFVKQLGANIDVIVGRPGATGWDAPIFPPRDRKGGDMNEWPEWARVREYPR